MSEQEIDANIDQKIIQQQNVDHTNEIDNLITKKDINKKLKRKKEAEKFHKEQENRGIIYISKVPPFMKPEKVRFIMSQFGDVDRIYLTPESAARRKARSKRGGTKKICYIDGWVEFLDKKIAKRVAITLNGTQVGGKKRNFHSEFIWNIRYLSKFKWDNLTEHKRQKDLTRHDKVKSVLSQAKKENELYLKRVDQAKMISAMNNKKKKDIQEKKDIERTETIARKQLEELRSNFRQRNILEEKPKIKQKANINLLRKAIGGKEEEPPRKKPKIK